MPLVNIIFSWWWCHATNVTIFHQNKELQYGNENIKQKLCYDSSTWRLWKPLTPKLLLDTIGNWFYLSELMSWDTGMFYMDLYELLHKFSMENILCLCQQHIIKKWKLFATNEGRMRVVSKGCNTDRSLWNFCHISAYNSFFFHIHFSCDSSGVILVK